MKNEIMKQEQDQKVEFRQFLSRKSLSLFLVVCVMVCCLVSVSADEVTVTPVTSSDWQSVIDSMTAQVSVATVVGVLTVIAAACIGLVFMWWGVRKATHALMAAFRKGKISI